MKKALFVIDVQKYFMNPLTKKLPKKISQYIEKNRQQFDLIIFTNFVNNPRSSVYQLLNWKGSSQSPDIDIVDDLGPVLKYGIKFSKDTYSVLKVPGIDKLLKQKNIKELFLCGFDTDCCVLATAYEGFDQGYKINLLEDLCMASSGINLHKTTISIFERNIL